MNCPPIVGKSEVNRERDWEHAGTKLRHCKLNEKTTVFHIAMDAMREHGKWDSWVFSCHPFPSAWLDVKRDKFLSISLVSTLQLCVKAWTAACHRITPPTPLQPKPLGGMWCLCLYMLIYWWLWVCVSVWVLTILQTCWRGRRVRERHVCSDFDSVCLKERRTSQKKGKRVENKW